jgi:hypothetical protein
MSDTPRAAVMCPAHAIGVVAAEAELDGEVDTAGSFLWSDLFVY